MAFYINDSIFGSIFVFLTGLHFFHVIVGIILIGIILCICKHRRAPTGRWNVIATLAPTGRRFRAKWLYRQPPQGASFASIVDARRCKADNFHLYYNLQLIYWHFIELLWLFIYLILYSY